MFLVAIISPAVPSLWWTWWGQLLCEIRSCLQLLAHLTCLSFWTELLRIIWGMGWTVRKQSRHFILNSVNLWCTTCKYTITFFSLLFYHLLMSFPLCVIFNFLFVSFAPLSHFINLGRNSSTGHDPTYIFIRRGPPQCSTWIPTAVVKAAPLSKAAEVLRKADFCIYFFIWFSFNV